MVQKSCKPDMVGSLSHPLPMNLYHTRWWMPDFWTTTGGNKKPAESHSSHSSYSNESMKHGRRKQKKDISKYFKIIMTNKIFPIHNALLSSEYDVIFFWPPQCWVDRACWKDSRSESSRLLGSISCNFPKLAFRMMQKIRYSLNSRKTSDK